MSKNTKIALYVAAFLPILVVSQVNPSSIVVAGILLIVTFIHMCIMLVMLGAGGGELIGFIPFFFEDVSLLIGNIGECLYLLTVNNMNLFKEGISLNPILKYTVVIDRIGLLFEYLAIVSVIVIVVRWLIKRYKKKVTVEGDAK